MGFNTNRPLTPQEQLDKLIERKQSRVTNTTQLLESINSAKRLEAATAVLESGDAEITANSKNTLALEAMVRNKMQSDLKKNSVTLENQLFTEGVKTVMNKVLFEMVYNAYWLDDSLKKNPTVLQDSYNEFRNVMSMVEETCDLSKVDNQNKSKFIINLESVVQETCKKAAKRLASEASEQQLTGIDFGLTDEEESDLDTKLDELGKDDIEELVKNKVLAVVQDEREAGKKKADMFNLINNTTETDPSGDPDSTDDSISESTLPVTEAVGEIILTTAMLGIVIAAVVLSTKEVLDLKKALKIYEKYGNPKIKASDITPTMYALDKAHRVTDKELSGISKFFNKNSKRAKVWKDKDDHVICTAILYTTTDVGAGATFTNNGVSPTVNVTTTYNYLYTVSDKYKDDALYLTALMGHYDGYSTRNTTAFVVDIKKGFKKQWANEKVKLLGKSLESTDLSDCELVIESNIIQSEPVVNNNPTPDEMLESLIVNKLNRSLNRSVGGTLFESMMISNSKEVQDQIVSEGLDISDNDKMSATLIQTILQYTVLETLDTMKLYSFTMNDVKNIRSTIMESISGQKDIRINTKKLKRNNDAKVMSSNGEPVLIGNEE
jgi:hypothetical protein